MPLVRTSLYLKHAKLLPKAPVAFLLSVILLQKLWHRVLPMAQQSFSFKSAGDSPTICFFNELFLMRECCMNIRIMKGGLFPSRSSPCACSCCWYTYLHLTSEKLSAMLLLMALVPLPLRLGYRVQRASCLTPATFSLTTDVMSFSAVNS